MPRSSSSTTDAKRKPKRSTTMHKLVWRHATCRIRHTCDYLSKGWDHLELIVVSPKHAPVPITSTGYLSHFMDHDLVVANGGPVAFFSAWLDREATTKAWAKAEFNWRQGDLFADSALNGA